MCLAQGHVSSTVQSSALVLQRLYKHQQLMIWYCLIPYVFRAAACWHFWKRGDGRIVAIACLLTSFKNIFYWNWASRVVTVQHKVGYSLTSRHPTSAPCLLRQWSMTLGSETTCWAPDSSALLAATRESRAEHQTSLVVHHFLSTVTPAYWKLGFSTWNLTLAKRHQKEKTTG